MVAHVMQDSRFVGVPFAVSFSWVRLLCTTNVAHLVKDAVAKQ